MSLIKLGLNGMSVPDKIQFGRAVYTATDNNPYFPTTNPTRAALLAKLDKLEASANEAQVARAIAKSKTSIQDADAAELDWTLTQLAAFIETASDGDKAKIESAGFSVRNPPVPIGELPAPVDLQVLPSEHSGSADVSWKSVYGAKSYLIERAEDAQALAYGVIGTSTKKQTSLNSMVSGKKYWFRVSAVGAAGQSAWSDPVPLFAP